MSSLEEKQQYVKTELEKLNYDLELFNKYIGSKKEGGETKINKIKLKLM